MYYADYIDIRRMMRDIMRDFREMRYHDPKVYTPLHPLHLSRSEGNARRVIRRHRAQLHVRSPTGDK